MKNIPLFSKLLSAHMLVNTRTYLDLTGNSHIFTKNSDLGKYEF